MGLKAKALLYWAIPGYRMIFGIVLMAIGLAHIWVSETGVTRGIVIFIFGLFALLSGASEFNSEKTVKRAPPPPVQAPQKPAHKQTIIFADPLPSKK